METDTDSFCLCFPSKIKEANDPFSRFLRHLLVNVDGAAGSGNTKPILRNLNRNTD